MIFTWKNAFTFQTFPSPILRSIVFVSFNAFFRCCSIIVFENLIFQTFLSCVYKWQTKLSKSDHLFSFSVHTLKIKLSFKSHSDSYLSESSVFNELRVDGTSPFIDSWSNALKVELLSRAYLIQIFNAYFNLKQLRPRHLVFRIQMSEIIPNWQQYPQVQNNNNNHKNNLNKQIKTQLCTNLCRLGKWVIDSICGISCYNRYLCHKVQSIYFYSSHNI